MDIIGVDRPFDVLGPSIPVEGIFISGTESPNVLTELWHIFENPYFEIVKILSLVAF